MNLGKRLLCRSNKIDDSEKKAPDPDQELLESTEGLSFYFKDATYLVMVLWITTASIFTLCCLFTWNAYARMVAGDNYQKHVDNFGSIAWTPAAFGLVCGPISDLLTKFFKNKSPAFGKILGVLMFVVVDLIVGIILCAFQVAIGG